MSTKTIGVLGGLGPHTSANFYLDIVNGYKEIGLNNRPAILIWNIPLDLEVERNFIEKGDGKDKYFEYLLEGATILEKGGADFIVIPCNTVHIHIDELRKKVKIPIISILEETADYIVKNDIKKVMLLATNETINENLYSDILKKQGIEVFIPDKKSQNLICGIINNILDNKQNDIDKKTMYRIIDNLKKNDNINFILACTDLQIIINKNDLNIPIHDTMNILAKSTITNSLLK